MLKKDLTDEQLVSLASQGDDEAMSLLIARVTPIAAAKASAFSNMRISGEDLVQEGMLGFLEAVKSYDAGKGVPFKAYAGICINNRILSAVREILNSKNAALSKAEPLDYTKVDFISAEDPAEYLFDAEAVSHIFSVLNNELSDFEKEVVKRRLSRFSYADIASQLGCSEKSVDNALQRIRKKMRKL